MSKPSQAEQIDAFFAGNVRRIALFGAVRQMVESLGPVEMQVMRSQIAFGTATKFAWVWTPLPGDRRPPDSLVLTFGLDHPAEDPQIVEVVEPYPGRWTHHVILEREADLTASVRQWLEEARAFAEYRGRRRDGKRTQRS